MSVSDQPYAGSVPAAAETVSSRAGVLSLFWSSLGEGERRAGSTGSVSRRPGGVGCLDPGPRLGPFTGAGGVMGIWDCGGTTPVRGFKVCPKISGEERDPFDPIAL